jgi:hypothetical protein
MNQSTIHTDPTARYAPTRPRIARIAAVVLLAVLAALAVQSFFTNASARPPAHDPPLVVRPATTSLCREFPKAHFEFIADRDTPPPASTCGTQTMLGV